MNKKHIIGLDGLRSIALICVLLYHTFPQIFPGGYFGVLIFFVISGYLSATSIFRSMKKHNFHLLKHYKKRILRLYPELFIVLASTVGVLTALDPYRLANTQQEVTSILLGYNNFWQISMNGDYFANITNNSPFTHLWYIAILLQFELIVPILCMLFQFIRKKINPIIAYLFFVVMTFISFLIMPLCVISQGITVVYYATYTRIFALLAGFTLGLFHTHGIHLKFIPKQKPFFTTITVLIFIGITVFLTFFVPGNHVWVYVIGMQLYTLLCLIVIEAINKTECSITHLLEHSVFHLISRYSYEIYLWQYPVLFLCGIKQWNQTTLHYCIQIGIILILSIWLNTFQTKINHLFKR